MATLDAIKSELDNLAKQALADRNPVLLIEVEACLIEFNLIQRMISKLKRVVDGLEPVPNVPNITIT